MNKLKAFLAVALLVTLVTGAFAERLHFRHRYSSDVLNLYAYNGSTYTELVSSGALDDGFTITPPLTGDGPARPATITNASGDRELLMTKIGSEYDTLYANNSQW
jgi:hypothetical protein